MAAEHVEVLRRLADRVAATAIERAGAVAALVVGSVAAGTSDEWSDLDLVLFYDSWPGAAPLDTVRGALEHLQRLASSFRVAPADLAARIDRALTAPMPRAAAELERLVDETLTIVARELPEVDVSGLRRSVGRREEAWATSGER